MISDLVSFVAATAVVVVVVAESGKLLFLWMRQDEKIFFKIWKIFCWKLGDVRLGGSRILRKRGAKYVHALVCLGCLMAHASIFFPYQIFSSLAKLFNSIM